VAVSVLFPDFKETKFCLKRVKEINTLKFECVRSNWSVRIVQYIKVQQLKITKKLYLQQFQCGIILNRAHSTVQYQELVVLPNVF
jgi:hypothetical protein